MRDGFPRIAPQEWIMGLNEASRLLVVFSYACNIVKILAKKDSR